MSDTPWRDRAERLTVHQGAWEDGEAVENLMEAITYALLDMADAVRGLYAQPEALARLTDAAPTAEALALLLRAQDHHPTPTEDPR